MTAYASICVPVNMGYQARCNKRLCQARRTLPKRVTMYIKRPKCHIPGCSGLMLMDEHRIKGKPQHGEFVEVCRLDCLPHPHKTNSKGCRGYREYMNKRNDSPRPKHSPIPAEEWVPF